MNMPKLRIEHHLPRDYAREPAGTLGHYILSAAQHVADQLAGADRDIAIAALCTGLTATYAAGMRQGAKQIGPDATATAVSLAEQHEAALQRALASGDAEELADLMLFAASWSGVYAAQAVHERDRYRLLHAITAAADAAMEEELAPEAQVPPAPVTATSTTAN